MTDYCKIRNIVFFSMICLYVCKLECIRNCFSNLNWRYNVLEIVSVLKHVLQTQENCKLECISDTLCVNYLNNIQTDNIECIRQWLCNRPFTRAYILCIVKYSVLNRDWIYLNFCVFLIYSYVGTIIHDYSTSNIPLKIQLRI